jgi:hypothetical protein
MSFSFFLDLPWLVSADRCRRSQALFSLCEVDCVLSQYNDAVLLSFIVFYAPTQCLYCVRSDVYSVLDFFVCYVLAAKQALNTESGFRLSYWSRLTLWCPTTIIVVVPHR